MKRIIIIILYLKRLSYNYRFPGSFHYGVGGSIIYKYIYTDKFICFLDVKMF